MDVRSYAPVSSVLIAVIGTSYTGQSNYSVLDIYDASYNGVDLDLSSGVYPNGCGTAFTPLFAKGPVTFPASTFWIALP